MSPLISRIENRLRAILDMDHELEKPRSRVEVLLVELNTLISDLQETVHILTSINRFLGVTTTELTNGATTNPILINNVSTTALEGDAVIYNGVDFVYNGSIWQDIPTFLGALAYKNSASGTYTPAGSVSAPDITVIAPSVTVKETLNEGVQSSMSYDSNTKTLTYIPERLPTYQNTSVMGPNISVTAGEPSFTGTQDTITVE